MFCVYNVLISFNQTGDVKPPQSDHMLYCATIEKHKKKEKNFIATEGQYFSTADLKMLIVFVLDLFSYPLLSLLQLTTLSTFTAKPLGK